MDQQGPRGGKKVTQRQEKCVQRHEIKKSLAYALIPTVSIENQTESACPSDCSARTQGCVKPKNQCHAIQSDFRLAKLDFRALLMCELVV